ncbi:pentapeptide repeat-containing protein [Pannus brasiliensis CCIBt3594]|uniref:Pentapeptide repeat-containing protein n=1 Tax=Pannus brasiliensis CCIBt3594 TaxID=1427578 RepID=A0AAW9QYT5_9CHRO
MPEPNGIEVSKPQNIFKREVKVNPRALFGTFAKAAVNGLFLQWDDLAENGAEVLDALGLQRTPGEIAGLLIVRSFLHAMKELLRSNANLLPQEIKVKDIRLKNLYNSITDSLENADLVLDRDFFERPENLSLISPTRVAFLNWLKAEKLIENEREAESISNRLPAYFVFALTEQWKKNREEYSVLLDEIDTPFDNAFKREREWLHYRSWLQKQIDEPVFWEAFSLREIYVSLRGFYEEEIEQEEKPSPRSQKSVQRVVVDLNDELESWLKDENKDDAIRLLTGGPGSGKSSFCKIFAARQAQKGRQVLFIPLHRFRLSKDLVEAIKEFIQHDGYLSENPVARDDHDLRLLIIFDGLDELSMQGKIAQDVAQQFIEEVRDQIRQFNYNQLRLQVVISGRNIAIQSNKNKFRDSRQIIDLLPYYVHEKEDYSDKNSFLEVDQRDLWWQQYGQAKGKSYSGLPSELSGNNLKEITAQPLLNYLVALSYEGGDIQFTKDTNLNLVYKDLLRKVYQRGYEQQGHRIIEGIEENNFVKILMEIAISCWHGDGRSTTVREIEAHCENSGLKNLLLRFQESFQEDSRASITRLLTAFYFRESGDLRESDKTFEFTHKSFGEYLTARRIVSRVQQIHGKLEASKDSFDDDYYDERQALTAWATLCGATAMDEYIYNFVVNEMRLCSIDEIRQWQKMLCSFIEYILVKGMPMEGLKVRPNFQEEMRQARNAEEALLAVLDACAIVTQEVSNIQWPSPESFGNWLSRIQGQSEGYDIAFVLDCLSFLNLNNCYLAHRYFGSAYLRGANFQESNLQGTYLSEAYLEEANLQGANLARADLVGAMLQGANLEGANLEGADLGEADLENVNLRGADLQGADLQFANLAGADLRDANLEGANLLETNFFAANLAGANLDGINLEEADFDEAFFGEEEEETILDRTPDET